MPFTQSVSQHTALVVYFRESFVNTDASVATSVVFGPFVKMVTSLLYRQLAGKTTEKNQIEYIYVRLEIRWLVGFEPLLEEFYDRSNEKHFHTYIKYISIGVIINFSLDKSNIYGLTCLLL